MVVTWWLRGGYVVVTWWLRTGRERRDEGRERRDASVAQLVGTQIELHEGKPAGLWPVGCRTVGEGLGECLRREGVTTRQ